MSRERSEMKNRNIINGIDVTEHFGMVGAIVYRHRWAVGLGGLEYGDLEAAGRIGLIRAARKFDPERGFKFSTYAVWWVRHEVGRVIADCRSTVRVPVYRQEKRYQEGEMLTPPVVSLDAPMSCGGDSDPFVAFFADPDPVDADATLQQRDDAAECAQLLKALSARERYVIRTCVTGDRKSKPVTMKAVADNLGLSRERVRQIKVKALEKMRRSAQRDGGSTYGQA